MKRDFDDADENGERERETSHGAQRDAFWIRLSLYSRRLRLSSYDVIRKFT